MGKKEGRGQPNALCVFLVRNGDQKVDEVIGNLGSLETAHSIQFDSLLAGGMDWEV